MRQEAKDAAHPTSGRDCRRLRRVMFTTIGILNIFNLVTGQCQSFSSYLKSSLHTLHVLYRHAVLIIFDMVESSTPSSTLSLHSHHLHVIFSIFTSSSSSPTHSRHPLSLPHRHVILIIFNMVTSPSSSSTRSRHLRHPHHPLSRLLFPAGLVTTITMCIMSLHVLILNVVMLSSSSSTSSCHLHPLQHRPVILIILSHGSCFPQV